MVVQVGRRCGKRSAESREQRARSCVTDVRTTNYNRCLAPVRIRRLPPPKLRHLCNSSDLARPCSLLSALRYPELRHLCNSSDLARPCSLLSALRYPELRHLCNSSDLARPCSLLSAHESRYLYDSRAPRTPVLSALRSSPYFIFVQKQSKSHENAHSGPFSMGTNF
jgi:hypothetical protein